MTLNLEPIRARAEAASEPTATPRWGDRVFKEHARADVLALCDEVERLRAVIAKTARLEDDHPDEGYRWIVGAMRGELERGLAS